MTITQSLFSKHSDSRLQFSWNCVQFGLFFLPLIPSVSTVILVLAMLITWWYKYRTIIRRPLAWGFALFTILLVIGTAFAEIKIEALLGLANLLPFFLLLLAYSELIQTPAQLRHLSWLIIIASVPVLVLGLGQQFLGWATPPLWHTLTGWELVRGGNPPGRMASAFMYANILAGYLTIVFILNLGLWLEDLQQLGKTDSKFYFLSLNLITCFAALILTNSRNAWAIAIIACFAYAVYQGWRLLVALVTGITACVLLAAFAPEAIAQMFRKIVPTFFWARLNDQMYPDRPVALMRKTQWDFAWSMAVQRPWSGWGLRNFTPLYQAKMQIWLGHPHNFFLMLAAETGIPATLLFCGIIIGILVASFRVLSDAKELEREDKLIFFSYVLVLLGWVIFNTVDVSLFDLRLNIMSWVLIAAVCGIVYRCRKLEKFS